MYIYINITYVFTIIFFCNFHSCQGKRILIARVTHFHTCEKSSEPPLVYLWKADLVNPKNNNTIVNLMMEATQDIDKPQIVIDVHRCIIQEVLDSCEKFTVLKLVQPCFFLTMKAMFWSQFVDSFQPPYIVDLRSNYSGSGIPADPNIFQMFQLEGSFWKAVVHVSNGKEFVSFCVGYKVYRVNI